MAAREYKFYVLVLKISFTISLGEDKILITGRQYNILYVNLWLGESCEY